MSRRVSVVPITLITLLITSLLVISGSSASGLTPQSDLKIESALFKLTQLDGRQARIWAQQQNIDLDLSSDTFSAIVEAMPGVHARTLSHKLVGLGARIHATGNQLLRAEIPISNAIALSQLGDVRYMRRPLVNRPLSVNPVNNRGVLETGGSLMHAHKFRGEGIKIAIIDNGFSGMDEAIARGLIPADAIIDSINYEEVDVENDSSHGLEVARIAHEMAPDAKLVFMSIGDEVDLENAVDDAIGMGVQVINHSIGWFNSNFGDGTGPIAELVKRANRAGIAWINAAGNQAASHWMGSGADDDENGWVEFGEGLESIEIFMQFPGQMDLVLVWNDFPTTRQDYDLILTDWQDVIIAASEERQTGLASPTEQLQHFVEQPGLYKIKVRVHDVHRPMDLKIFAMDQVISPAVPEGSVVAPADCECAVAVGAVSIREWQRGFIEFFSAQGPTTDGRIKPDLVAPDGMRGLNGTSFSSPHVAGAAALLLSQDPTLSVDQLKAMLTKQTLDIYAPGKDNITGFGQLEMRLAEPEAHRELSSASLSGDDQLTVTVRAVVPALQFGRLVLTEYVPSGFEVEVLDADGGSVQIESVWGKTRLTWIRELLGPGDEIEVEYAVRPLVVNAENGTHEIYGELNGKHVLGSGQFEYERRAISPQRAARHNSVPLVAPVQGFNTMRFMIAPQMLQSAADIRVQILDLNGKLVSDSGWVTPQRVVILLNRDWPSGVYLYLFAARDGSEAVVERTLRKFHVLSENSK